MTRSQSAFILLVALTAMGCGTGGREYWLYPEPHLDPQDEALFEAYESHRIIAIDGGDTASRCWGRTVHEPQAYRRNDLVCRLHLRPGQHTVVFEGSLAMGERNRVEFTAEPGKRYRLNWSDCMTPPGGYQQTCQVNVVEFDEFSRNPA